LVFEDQGELVAVIVGEENEVEQRSLVEADQRSEENELQERERVGRSELAVERVVSVSLLFAEEDHKDWHMLLLQLQRKMLIGGVVDLVAVETVQFVGESNLVVQVVRRLAVGSKPAVSLQLEEKRLLNLLLARQVAALSTERICWTRSLSVEMALRWAA